MSVPPVVLGFVFCEELYERPSEGRYAAFGISHARFVPEVPAFIEGDVLVQLTEVHGDVGLCIELQDASGEVQWKFETKPECPVVSPHPLEVVNVVVRGVRAPVLRYGRYNFVLYANGVEVFRTRLDVAPKRQR